MTLGKEELQAGWRIGSVPGKGKVIDIAYRLINFVGMTPDPPADVRAYPNSEGRGGLGIQIYLPLVESWLVISTWPAHGFTRVNLSSCQSFDPVAVGNFLEKEFKAKIQAFWSSPL
jgi:hypothetical protein